MIYWFKHWLAYQLIAFKYKCWKWRFLFHDIEKPWLQLFISHDKVSKWHREHSRHHVEYKGSKKLDYLGMIIDWECARYTKPNKPLNARKTFELYCKNYPGNNFDNFKINITYLLNKYKL